MWMIVALDTKDCNLDVLETKFRQVVEHVIHIDRLIPHYGQPRSQSDQGSLAIGSESGHLLMPAVGLGQEQGHKRPAVKRQMDHQRAISPQYSIAFLEREGDVRQRIEMLKDMCRKHSVDRVA